MIPTQLQLDFQWLLQNPAFAVLNVLEGSAKIESPQTAQTIQNPSGLAMGRIFEHLSKPRYAAWSSFLMCTLYASSNSHHSHSLQSFYTHIIIIILIAISPIITSVSTSLSWQPRRIAIASISPGSAPAVAHNEDLGDSLLSSWDRWGLGDKHRAF